MKKTVVTMTMIAALLLTGCGSVHSTESEAPAAGAQTGTSEASEPAVVIPETAEPAAESGRQDGERFEDTIILEGMEEPVHYEHIRNETLGFEMDYDYDLCTRQSSADRERIVSSWDDPDNPEDYLDVTHDTGNAELVADVIIARLSEEYDPYVDYIELDHVGRCIYIMASGIKNTNQMAERLQTVYVIPAQDGCLVAEVHCFVEEAEGMGRRFSNMVNTLSLLNRG